MAYDRAAMAERVNAQTYAGLFMIALATLMYEILLTRIFSVTMWYHFAFMAISVAMLGMTVGAELVYLLPGRFREARVPYHLALNALLFAASIVFSFLTHLSVPFAPQRSLVSLYTMALTYVVVAVPFVFSGICVCLALTRFPRHVGKLYAADLAGAALGCVLLIYVIRMTDGPTAVLIVAFLASLGAVCFAVGAGHPRLSRVALLSCLALAGAAAVQTALLHRGAPPLRLMWVKGRLEPSPLYEKWNSFSRITVHGDPRQFQAPHGWGLSSAYRPARGVRQLYMGIDTVAGTVLTAFDGDLADLAHLKYDVTNIVHHIRRDSRVLVVGTGGGRDILSALAFGQRDVLAVEINDDIIDVVNRRFGDFTGHLDRHPRVTFVHDEARSYVARHQARFDIIQVSLIDTFAATAAGAFALTENSIYTVEAWKLFLDRLSPPGVLSFSRWYVPGMPSEVYRLTSLAATALGRSEVTNPRQHLLLVRHLPPSVGGEAIDGVATLLVGKAPFSATDLDTVEAVAREMRFDVVLSPRSALDPTLATIASGQGLDTVMARLPINLAPPTDDNPFFFNMLRLREALRPEVWSQELVSVNLNLEAVMILAVLLVVVVALTLLCVAVPLALTGPDTAALRGSWPLFLYFAGIGLGFMLVEISQMQRLIIFLGHPTYSLSVVLFALLLSSGLGSYSTGRIPETGFFRAALVRLAWLVAALIAFGILTPHAIGAFQASTTGVRIVVATAILFPLGFCMGMAFPVGMKIASAKAAGLTPWLWGINGATSVCASVLAVVIAVGSGISTSFWTGVSAYGLALIAFAWAGRSGRVPAPWPVVTSPSLGQPERPVATSAHR
jgi:SAM-dependent methyltransferase